jgi:hypothetical protein
MAAADGSASKGPAGRDRFPALKSLEEQVERTRLEQALAEARAAKLQAALPDFNVEIARDTAAFGDKTTGLAPMLVQHDAIALADDIADLVLDAARDAATADSNKRKYSFTVISDPAALQDLDLQRARRSPCSTSARRVASNSIAQTALLPFRRCRSRTGAGRAAPDACSSSNPGVWARLPRTPPFRRREQRIAVL